MNNYWQEHIASSAVRELGAGGPWHFGAHTKELQRWHEQERDRGHALDKKDLQHEWEDRLEMSIELLKKFKEKWTAVDAQMVRIMEAKLHTLQQGSPGAREKVMNVMCHKIGARLLVPSRRSQLAEGEEEVRAELTWQQMDERLFIAGCADLAELKTWVADPSAFQGGREKTWLIFSDQVPIWIKIGMLKILYSAAELAETGKRAQAAVKAARRQLNMTQGKDSQQLVPAEAEAAELNEEEVVEEASGKGQKRDLPSDIESVSEEEAANGPRRRGPWTKKGKRSQT